MMLRGSLVVHGADFEKVARSAIRDSGLRLSWDREEELLAELLVHVSQFSSGFGLLERPSSSVILSAAPIVVTIVIHRAMSLSSSGLIGTSRS
jgi:hypothetical protein